MATKDIKLVAIYLRKSRAEEDPDVLNKHRSALIRYCETHDYAYQLYEESPMSGEDLKSRPVIMQLLSDIEKGMYDAILCMEIDRLVRERSIDAYYVKQALLHGDAIILTPSFQLDLNSDFDDSIYGFKTFFANEELKMIKRRFTTGKQIGATKGNLTNGKPPYPYNYDLATKQCYVDKDKLEIYNNIKRMYIEDDMGVESIAHVLNKQGVLSPNGLSGKWSPIVIQRLLDSEFHLGKIIFGKTKWLKRKEGQTKVIKVDESNWHVGIGKHEKTKTPEEHALIQCIKERRNKIPKRAMAGNLTLSALLFCGKCGKRMQFSIGKKEKKSGLTWMFTRCGQKNRVGILCEQVGCKLTHDFYQALYDEIIKSSDTEKVNKHQDNKHEIDAKKQIDKHNKEIDKIKQELARAMTAFERGIYTIEEFSESKKQKQGKIISLNKEISNLNAELEPKPLLSYEELRAKIEYFKQHWSEISSPNEQNQLLRSFIKKITYDREDDVITLQVEYL